MSALTEDPKGQSDPVSVWLLVAWVLSFSGMLGSLFFSEVMNFPACVLCWYQRICLYPLVIILGVGIWDKDRRIVRYACPFIVIGFLIALYQNLLYYHVISESLSPCKQGISCTERQIEWLGFISIPLLSMLSFIAIGLGMLKVSKHYRGTEL